MEQTYRKAGEVSNTLHENGITGENIDNLIIIIHKALEAFRKNALEQFMYVPLPNRHLPLTPPSKHRFDQITSQP